MKRVYIPNKGPHDYSEAERFGELVFCTIGSLDKYDTAEMFRELEGAMHDSQAEDLLLVTSLTSLCCVAAAIFASRHQRINLLIHRGDSYVKREIHLSHLGAS